MRLLVVFFVFGILTNACGVKAPPIAPERLEEPSSSPKVTNCSVYDPNCDKEDPSYVPQGKSGK